jgi:hypothetical protein
MTALSAKEGRRPWGKKSPGGRRPWGKRSPGGEGALGEEGHGGREASGVDGYHSTCTVLEVDNTAPFVSQQLHQINMLWCFQHPSVAFDGTHALS